MLGLLTYHIDTGGRVARSQIQASLTNKGGAEGNRNLILCEINNKQKV